MATREAPDHYWIELASDDPAVSLSARHRIALHYTWLVEGCAYKLKARLPTWVDEGDLVSSGWAGLLRSIDRYDASRGLFSKFASVQVHGSIVDEIRRQDWAPRSLRRTQREINQVRTELTAEDGRPPTLQDIATKLGWEQAQVESTLRRIEQADMVNGYVPPNSNTDLGFSSPEEESERAAEERFDIHSVCRLFAHEYLRMPPLVQLVLARIYYLGQTLPQVSKVMGVSTGTVRRLHMEGVRRALATAQSMVS